MIARQNVGLVGIYWAVLTSIVFASAAFAASTYAEKYCFTKPAGDTSGGSQCGNQACWMEGSGVYYRVDGESYTKCGDCEDQTCTEPGTGSLGDGGPKCATKTVYDTMVDCNNGSGGSTSQTFYSSFPRCE